MTSSWPDSGDDVEADDGSGTEHTVQNGAVDDRIPEPARRALVSLLMNRYISRARNRAAWEGVLAAEHDLRARLDEMYLDLVIDRDSEVAFKRQRDGEDVPRMLRREKALSRDASFVLIFLRREYAFADPDAGPVVITREQISEFLRAYREEGDGDDARFSRRVDAAISPLVSPWQILERDPAVDYLFTISPVIVPLIGADEMRRFDEAFRTAAGEAGSPPPDTEAGVDTAGTGEDDTDDGEEERA